MGWGSNENYAKVGHRGSGVGSPDLILNFGTPSLISQTAEARDLEICMIIKGGAQTRTMQTSAIGSRAGSCDLVLNFGIPSYLRND